MRIEVYPKMLGERSSMSLSVFCFQVQYFRINHHSVDLEIHRQVCKSNALVSKGYVYFCQKVGHTNTKPGAKMRSESVKGCQWVFI